MCIVFQDYLCLVAVKIYILLYHPGVLSLINNTYCGMYSIVIIMVLFIQDGRTPLLWASFYGHTAVVELLLLNNADVTICDEV